jgi:hypothetical protein
MCDFQEICGATLRTGIYGAVRPYGEGVRRAQRPNQSLQGEIMDAVVSRRDAIRAGVAGSRVLAIAASNVARAADTKLAKATVQYVDDGKLPGKDCDDCIQFIPGKTAKDAGTCKIVEGAINPHGHCLAFSPKP